MYTKGFTLIELVLVVGILSVLLAITVVAINPGRQFAQANNTKRFNDVGEILSALNQYQTSNRGVLPIGVDTSVKTITNDTNIAASLRVDICASIIPTYIAALPVDPAVNNGQPVGDCSLRYNTNYTVVMGSNNRLTVAAPAAQNGQTISVTR